MKIQRYWFKLAAGVAILIILLLFFVRPDQITREMRESNLAWIALAGALHIVGDMIELRYWQVLHEIPGTTLVISDIESAIGA